MSTGGLIPAPDEAFIEAAEVTSWRLGAAALGSSGAERADYVKAYDLLLGIREVAELWRSGAPPDPAAWPP